MKKYELVIENPTNAYILDKEENTIVAICNTKRPDLEFNKLKDLIKKANENNLEAIFNGDKEPNEKVITLLQTNKEELIKWIGRCAWHCKKVDELSGSLKWIKEQYETDFTEEELNNLEPRDEVIYNLVKGFNSLVLNKFKGWEILKLIDEGKLKENDIVIWHNGADAIQEKCRVTSTGIIVHDGFETDLSMSYLSPKVSQGYFTIQEKEYMTFDEARKTGKRLKHKDWRNFRHLVDTMAKLSQLGAIKVNKMLDEKAWEVEEDDGQKNMD